MDLNFVRNTTVMGKWNKNRYCLINLLGKGAMGSVYLAEALDGSGQFALKISTDNLTLNREYQRLNQFQHLDWVVRVYELDDWETSSRTLYFLVLEYIEGSNLKAYTRAFPPQPALVLGLTWMLWRALGRFFESGHILGDLKPENIMVDRRHKQVRLIDLGSMVKWEEGLKEYTPAYDLVAWRGGERRAGPEYQQFALHMMTIGLLLGETPDPRVQTVETLGQKIRALPVSTQLIQFLLAGLEQKIPLEKFENVLNGLYNKERHQGLVRRSKELDRFINLFFAGSLGSMLLVLLLLLLR